jgi:site-specific DNA recombinase
MKLVGYVRISTESQIDNTSIDDQIEKLQAYCKAFSHDLVEIFVEVQSGKTASARLEFMKAMEMVKVSGDGIIATKLDRIARSTRDVLSMVEDVLIPNKKSLVLLDLNVDTSTPTGIMVLTMLAAMAQLERSIIIERTQGGRKRKQENGGYAYGSPKFGQQSINAELVEDEGETATIETIRKHRKSGKSYQKIADYLNENNIKSKQNKRWYPQTVKVVIDNLK